MGETYTIQKLRTTFPGTGWKPYVRWAAVDDEDGSIIMEGETRQEVEDWGRRLADEVNGTIHGMSYEQWQSWSGGE